MQGNLGSLACPVARWTLKRTIGEPYRSLLWLVAGLESLLVRRVHTWEKEVGKYLGRERAS